MSQSGRAVKKSIVGILDRTLCFETINQQKFYTVCQNTGSTRINQNTLKTISIAIAVTGPVLSIDPQVEYYTYRIREVFWINRRKCDHFPQIIRYGILSFRPPSLPCLTDYPPQFSHHLKPSLTIMHESITANFVNLIMNKLYWMPVKYVKHFFFLNQFASCLFIR